MATLCHVCRCLTNRKRPSAKAQRLQDGATGTNLGGQRDDTTSPLEVALSK